VLMVELFVPGIVVAVAFVFAFAFVVAFVIVVALGFAVVGEKEEDTSTGMIEWGEEAGLDIAEEVAHRDWEECYNFLQDPGSA